MDHKSVPVNTPPSKSDDEIYDGMPSSFMMLPHGSFVRVPTDEYLSLQKEVEALRTGIQLLETGKYGRNEIHDQLTQSQAEVKRLLDERTDLTQWFEHRHVYGTFTLEQRDVMSPREMADYCYERKAEQVEVAHEALKKAKVALSECLKWPQVSKNEATVGAQQAIDAIKECGL